MKRGKNGISDFIDIYLDYYAVVFGTIYSWLRNKEDAEDICHEVFLRFYEKMDNLEDINIRSWLLVTAKNIMLNFINKKKPANISELKDFDESCATHNNGHKDTQILINNALDSIACNEIDRNIIELIAVNNFTYKETACLTGLSRRQVEYRYTQLVKKLLDYLQAMGIYTLGELL